MEIVFVRHGQTDLNKEVRLQGALIDAELNQAGRAYAKKAAEKFNYQEFSEVYASPLKRAVETAEIFTHNQKKITLDKRLIEFDFGDWDGKKMSEIIANYPDVIDPWGKIDQNYEKYAHNGETYQAFEKRCASFIKDAYQKHVDDKILVVAHGRLIRMMAAHLLNHGQMDMFDTMSNCAIAKFRIHDQLVRMDYYNRVLA